jgi:hypothetical protein
MMYAIAFAASFAFVFLKALQQLNVVHANYFWIVPISFAMAACEVYTVAAVATSGWGWVILPIGAGASLGCILAIVAHKRFIR